MVQEMSHFSENFIYLSPLVTLKLGQGLQNPFSPYACHNDIFMQIGRKSIRCYKRYFYLQDCDRDNEVKDTKI